MDRVTEDLLALTADRAARALVGRYCEAVLRYDVAAFTDCWALDARWGVRGSPLTEGRARIVRAFEKLRGPLPRCVQELSSGVVEVLDTETVGARWVIRELQWAPDGSTTALIGVYHDIIGREDGSWRFLAREFELLARGAADLPALI
jgi:uncharacterized protein (TIGR02246 family)